MVSLPKASSYTVNEIITGQVVEAHDTDITEPITTYSIPLPSFKICELQESDEKLCWLHPRIEKGQLADNGYFIDTEDDLLQWRISDNSQDFKPVVLPNSLISTALLLTDDHTGHNGFRRIYAALKQLYYWKGMKKDVLMHYKHCQVCAKQKVEKTKYIKDNFRPGSIHGIQTLQDFQWPWVCPHSYLHVDRLCVLYSLEDQNSRGNCGQILHPCHLHIWEQQEDIIGQWYRVQKHSIWGGGQTTRSWKENLLTSLQVPDLMDILKVFTNFWKNASLSTWWTS